MGNSRLRADAVSHHLSAIYAENCEAYGWPRIWRQLQVERIRVGKQLLMRQHGIQARDKRYVYLTTADRRHDLPIAPSVLDRNFTVARPFWRGLLIFTGR